jgi:hypothetical protein
MAHFAQLDENNIVLNVVVVNNSDILDEDGKEKEEIGIAFCKNLLGNETKWVQTSYNESFRKNYAMIGEIYDVSRDAFRKKDPPFPSWMLDEESCQWRPPVELPSDWKDKSYSWDEATISWIEKSPKTDRHPPTWIYSDELKRWIPPIPYPTDNKKYTWNEETQTWNAVEPILDGKPPEVI